jgi:hypothetical protein
MSELAARNVVAALTGGASETAANLEASGKVPASRS